MRQRGKVPLPLSPPELELADPPQEGFDAIDCLGCVDIGNKGRGEIRERGEECLITDSWALYFLFILFLTKLPCRLTRRRKPLDFDSGVS